MFKIKCAITPLTNIDFSEEEGILFQTPGGPDNLNLEEEEIPQKYITDVISEEDEQCLTKTDSFKGNSFRYSGFQKFDKSTKDHTSGSKDDPAFFNYHKSTAAQKDDELNEVRQKLEEQMYSKNNNQKKKKKAFAKDYTERRSSSLMIKEETPKQEKNKTK